MDIFDEGEPDIGSTTKASSSSTAATDNVHNCNDSPPTITLTAPSTCPASGCTITATATQGTHPLTSSDYPDYPGTVTFTLNGKEINKQYVSTSPSTVTFNYSPTSSGSGTLEATVTDSVLYSGTASTNMTYSAPSAISGVSFSPSSGSTTPTVSWSGGSGNYTVSVSSGTGCTTTSSSCSITVPANTSNINVTVSDDQGDTSGQGTYSSSP